MAAGSRGIRLSDEDKKRIREYIETNHLEEVSREKLAVMITADLNIPISGKSAAKIREEALYDITLSNSHKEEHIRSQVLDEVGTQAPKILGYIEDEVRELRELAGVGLPKNKRPIITITERVKVSSAIIASCKSLIEVLGPPKPDRHITTTLEVVETADVSEYQKYGDKDGPDTTEMDDPEGEQEA
jgi:hypothetical protein